VFRYFMLAHRRTLIPSFLAHRLRAPSNWRRPGRIWRRDTCRARRELPPFDRRCHAPRSRTNHHRSHEGRRPAPRSALAQRRRADRVRHLYELARYASNCDGTSCVSGLVDRWEKRDDAATGGRFTPARGAQFWTARPSQARDIVFGKGGVGYTPRSAREKRPWHSRSQRETTTFRRLLGDPSLAVTKPAPDSSWPIGTERKYWATSATTTAQEIPCAHDSRRHARVQVCRQNGDARDLLTRRDLLINARPGAARLRRDATESPRSSRCRGTHVCLRHRRGGQHPLRRGWPRASGARRGAARRGQLLVARPPRLRHCARHHTAYLHRPATAFCTPVAIRPPVS